MWHDRRTKRGQRWLWQGLERDPGPLLAGAWGRRDTATWQKRIARLAPWDVIRSGTDKWPTYASRIPPDQRVPRKAPPHAMERHPCRQRHGCGRFQRQSLGVSQSKEMGELTMALVATFWIKGNQDALLSRNRSGGNVLV